MLHVTVASLGCAAALALCNATRATNECTLLLLLLLLQILHDTDAGLGCSAALALRTLVQCHPVNQ
jgi:hypothetical protein